MQGFAAIKGNGLELVFTLGTGVGTGFFRNGELNLKPDYSADPMLFHAAIACARGSSDT